MKIHLTIIFLLITPFLFAQQNLVPNPSFEEYILCPDALNEMSYCQSWSSYGNSPDYFNFCAPAGISVPNSCFGFQYAHGGVAMIGLGTYRWPGSPDGPNYREYAGTQLINPLLIGQKYFISFFTNFAYGPSVAVATDKIGLRFSTINYTSLNVAPINNIVHLYTDSIITDSIIWYKISGSFIADSSYNYVEIGNFFQDSLTDTLHVPSSAFPDYSYYYIDDVCVSADSLTCNQPDAIIENSKTNKVNIFPNPATTELTIDFALTDKSYFELYDVIGVSCPEIGLQKTVNLHQTKQI